MGFTLTKERLLHDLYIAFYDARKHKASKSCVVEFERNLKSNLEELCDSLYERKYTPLPSNCFIVNYPKKREIFAARFRDRVVHHLYYNYTSNLFERTFVQDSYSCIKGRGTHYGIKRLQSHIKKASQNYTNDCYVLKLDIRGYFMNINRNILNEVSRKTILKISKHKVNRHGTLRWHDIMDIDFVLWLTSTIVMLDPTIGCNFASKKSEWIGLERNKSLFWTASCCGLPIGNLTSQLFSNVYLNAFDQFVKRTLKIKYYGRYVDDAYVVLFDKGLVQKLSMCMRNYLKEKLELELHMGKLRLLNARHGVEFLGGYTKPFRTYLSSRTLERVKTRLIGKDGGLLETINSYLGMMRHYSSFNLRYNLFINKRYVTKASFDKNVTKIVMTA